jgi:predicted transcriptional regulator YdeE/catechol 2,3-dioxygenase-like lactoylglutathione lyase family enzyme
VSEAQVEIVRLDEKCYVGVPVTSSFQNVVGIGEARQIFMEKKNEIQNIVNKDLYACLHFANDVLFTYVYCMEVSAIGIVPQGMIGFTVPGNRYAKVRTKDTEPYAFINSYLSANRMEKDSSSLAIEIFKFGENEHYNNADILVPIKLPMHLSEEEIQMGEQVIVSPITSVVPAVFVYVTNIKKSVEWYCKLLGLPQPEQIRESMHIFDLSGNRCSNIFLERREIVSPSPEPMFSLTAPNNEAVFQFLSGHGIEITHRNDEVIYFKDPDGNVINACSI